MIDYFNRSDFTFFSALLVFVTIFAHRSFIFLSIAMALRFWDFKTFFLFVAVILFILFFCLIACLLVYFLLLTIILLPTITTYYLNLLVDRSCS